MMFLLKNYWKSILATGIILLLSFMVPPRIHMLNQIEFKDKYAHVILYLMLSFILVWDTRRSGNRRNDLKSILICLVYPILLGGLIEILQTAFFPPRTAEWLDWAADTLGTFAGIAVYPIISRLFCKKNIQSDI